MLCLRPVGRRRLLVVAVQGVEAVALPVDSWVAIRSFHPLGCGDCKPCSDCQGGGMAYGSEVQRGCSFTGSKAAKAFLKNASADCVCQRI
jgi:hypothetical protein